MARTMDVTTNFYPIDNYPRVPYFHFDVRITRSSPTAQPEEIVVKARNYEIMDRLQTSRPDIFRSRAIYDGRNNMFYRNDVTGDYEVAMGRSQDRATHKISVKRVSVINPEDLRRLTTAARAVDGNVMPLTLLQLIIRQAPNYRHGFPADAKSFYVASTSKNLGRGLSAWRGYFQSVRPTIDRLLINIDVSHAVLYTPGPLIDAMMSCLELHDIRDLNRIETQHLRKLRQFLKGVRITVPISRMRPRPITDLVGHAGRQEFDKGGERTTVQAHFESKYNVRLRYPDLIGVKIGRGAVIPAEFCEIVPGQLYRKKITPQLQKPFLTFATQRPADRLKSIEDAMRGGTFNYTDSDFMRDAGMTVGQTPISIPAGLLGTPKIKYGDTTLSIPEKEGKWNLLHRRFLTPSTLTVWAAANFCGERYQDAAERFITTLVGNLTRLGITVNTPHPRIMGGNPATPITALNQIGEGLYGHYKRLPQLILVFLPENAADCRQAVKRWGDTRRAGGVSTQCLRIGKWDIDRGRDQYCNNVALKINARLGGINSVLESPVNKAFEDSMVVGVDVGHPGPGLAHRPSITGLVASVDRNAVCLTSSVRLQDPRVEIIQNLKEMMMEALKKWDLFSNRNRQGAPGPNNIIFYRDGVSEGEYAQVAAQEIPMIQRAFDGVKQELRHWQNTPKILFVVVTKRHHVRFFPKRLNDGDRTGNCPAGLLVEQGLKNPQYEDFYLQSHAGLLGTSRPSHYIIIKNETALTKQQIQTLTFHLCHTYVSATRSVSIPAPVYYADKICQRLDIHCENGASLSDTASNVTGEQAPPFNLEEWNRKFKPSTLTEHMYFI